MVLPKVTSTLIVLISKSNCSKYFVFTHNEETKIFLQLQKRSHYKWGRGSGDQGTGVREIWQRGISQKNFLKILFIKMQNNKNMRRPHVPPYDLQTNLTKNNQSPPPPPPPMPPLDFQQLCIYGFASCPLLRVLRCLINQFLLQKQVQSNLNLKKVHNGK